MDLQDRKSWPWWKAKKWMLHISHRLFQRYGDPKLTNPGTPERAFAELWKQHCSSQFLEAHLSLLASISQVTPMSSAAWFHEWQTQQGLACPCSFSVCFPIILSRA